MEQTVSFAEPRLYSSLYTAGGEPNTFHNYAVADAPRICHKEVTHVCSPSIILGLSKINQKSSQMLDKCLFYEEKTSLPLSLLVKHRAALDLGGDLWSRTHRRKPSRKASYTPQPRSLAWRIPLKDSGLKDLSLISFCCRLSQAWFSRCPRGCFGE